MKTKFAMLLAVILVMSIFAGALTIAENSAPKTNDDDTAVVSPEDLGDINSIASVEEIEDTIGEIEETVPYKRIGFSKTWVGNGWIENTNGRDGYLIQGFWVKQAFAKNGNSDDLNDADFAGGEIDKTFGKLRIGFLGKFKLVLTSSSEVEKIAIINPDGSTDTPEPNSITFDVIPIGDVDSSKGILTLEKSEQFKQLTIWKGKLKFNDGILKGNWDVSLGTNKNVIKAMPLPNPEEDESPRENGDGKVSPSLMQKWFGKKEVNTGNKAENTDDDSGVTDNSGSEKPKKIPFWKRWFSTSNVEDSSE